LFQYAALKGLASKNGYTAKIPNPQTMNWHGQTCLLDRFNIDCDYLTQEDANTLQNLYEEPNWNKYDANFFNIPDSTSLEGFFQSTFYFEHISEQIKKELTPKQEYLDKATKFIDYLKGQHNCEIVSVLKFLVFTGGQRFNEDNKIDVDWCRSFFKGDEFLFSEGNPQIDDFSLIMSCDHNILSHASSFGWWAAYVNPNPNKIVVAPEYYHPDEPSLKRDMFYPKEFILK